MSQAIEKVKQRADTFAAKNALRIRAMATVLTPMLATVRPNFKFFRRMAGLRNGDLQRKDL